MITDKELSVFTELGFTLERKDYFLKDKAYAYFFTKKDKTAFVTLGGNHLTVTLNGRDIPLASKLSMHFGIPTFEMISRGSHTLEWELI